MGLRILVVMAHVAFLGLPPTPAVAALRVPQERPPWVVDGVPDTVWILVEGTYGEADRDEARRMLVRAEVVARAAVEGHEADVGRRFALAVVLGRRADLEGGRTKVTVASEFHRELEAILRLDPDHPQAHHLMGRLYAGVRRMGRLTRWIATNLLGGDELKKATWEAAEAHLLFAEQRQPEVSEYHLQLANLYRDTGRPELALGEVDHVLALPVNTPLEAAVRAEALAMRPALVERLGAKGSPAPRG
ncbi:MAG TPA: hypothetical protein VJ997_15570 [Longimicrobiales bacterium]|nr:hypothetical protein [Longimicrobiales bacterium]